MKGENNAVHSNAKKKKIKIQLLPVEACKVKAELISSTMKTISSLCFTNIF